MASCLSSSRFTTTSGNTRIDHPQVPGCRNTPNQDGPGYPGSMDTEIPGTYCQNCFTWNPGERETCRKCGTRLLIVTGDQGWEEEEDEAVGMWREQRATRARKMHERTRKRIKARGQTITARLAMPRRWRAEGLRGRKTVASPFLFSFLGITYSGHIHTRNTESRFCMNGSEKMHIDSKV